MPSFVNATAIERIELKFLEAFVCGRGTAEKAVDNWIRRRNENCHSCGTTEDRENAFGTQRLDFGKETNVSCESNCGRVFAKDIFAQRQR